MDARVNITMREEFLKEVDRLAKEEHLTRSALIRESLEAYIVRKNEELAEKERRERMRKAAKLQDALAKKTGKWDTVQAVRRIREQGKF